MTNSSNSFELALPLPVSYSVQDNKYENSKEKFPKMARFFIPLESAYDFAQHIMSLCDNEKYHKDGKVYDMNAGEQIETKGVVIYGKGRVGTFDEDEYGAYGSFNPVKAERKEKQTTDEIPF